MQSTNYVTNISLIICLQNYRKLFGYVDDYTVNERGEKFLDAILLLASFLLPLLDYRYVMEILFLVKIFDVEFSPDL